jgi:ubiquinone/menaquinone biosynthesis C-methylase UbiE
MRVEQRAVRACLGELRGTALDLGTGTGRYRGILRDLGAARVVGVDRSAAMLAAGSRADSPRAALVRADAVALPFTEGVFDVAVAGLMVADVGAFDRLLGELARVLRARGRFVYSDFHPAWSKAGWRRTFTGADGRMYELPRVARRLADHAAALRTAGFEVEQVHEVRLDDEVVAERAGRGWPVGLHGGDGRERVSRPRQSRAPVAVAIAARRQEGQW